MRVTWHQPIEMDDGLVLRADVFCPISDGHYPVILTYGGITPLLGVTPLEVESISRRCSPRR
jgi:predicted acyl esterase